MHMGDALISPAVGGTMWAAAAGLLGYSAWEMRRSLDERRVPLMGVMGAFVFAGQMVNFTIPLTGSSGHLGGGLLLTILLGPPAAFITIASILAVQALFFADGGLLALGCNIVNMGLFPCFIAYPLIYLPLAGRKLSPARISVAAVVAAVVGLQLGALGVVGETMMSGISDLSFGKFALLMQPIHLAIGIVEGLVTAAVVSFVHKARPEVLDLKPTSPAGSFRPVLVGLSLVAVLTAGVLSWFASRHPDGLEWSVAKTTGSPELAEPADGIHGTLRSIQDRSAFLPGYGTAEDADWGRPSAGTSLAGLVGGGLTLVLATGIAWLVRKKRSAAAPAHGDGNARALS